MSFTYDNANRRTLLTLPNGVLVEYAYDAASRVTAITYKQNGATVLGDLTYEYDKNGSRTKIGGSFARASIPESVNTTNYNDGNQQTTVGDKALTYDSNGNLTSITDSNGTTLYAWNPRNQLVGITGPNVNASFVYDGLGRRQRKIVNGNTTDFLYDGVNPIQEGSGATIVANILPGLTLDEVFARTDVTSGTTSSFLSDGLGSSLALTDASGAVQTEYTYEPFGKTTMTGASNTSSLQFTGRENDASGLYFYRARYYHPDLQRFISEDSMGVIDGFNIYAYVGNNPTNRVDPTGKWAIAIPAVYGLGELIYVGSAALAGYLLSKTVGTLSPEQQAEKDAEYKEYKKRCRESPPSGLDKCADAKWRLQRNIDCLQMREAWDRKWNPGAHDDEIDSVRRSIKNAQDDVNRYCRCP